MHPAIIAILALLAAGFVLWLALFIESSTWGRARKPPKTGVERDGQLFPLVLALLAITALSAYGVYWGMTSLSRDIGYLLDDFVIPSIILFLGFLISFFLYQRFRMRIAGVIATPLLAVYILVNPLTLPVVIAIVLVLFGILHWLYIRYYIYGRRLFLIGCAFSIVISAPILILLGLTNVIIITILPAIFAYNAIIDVQHRARSAGLLSGELGVLVVVGALLMTLF